MENKYMKLSKADKEILESYRAFVEGLGKYMGEGYEIVVHSLENLERSAIKIINGFHSGRKEGAPITDLALQMLAQMEHNSHSALCYFNKSKSGAPIKSTTIPLLGEKQRIIGLICINFYTETPLCTFLMDFFPKATTAHYPESMASETFSENKDELILQALTSARDMVYGNPTISTINKNKEIITILQEKGIFNLKDAVITVSSLLNISKNTVYMHIRNLNSEKMTK